MAGSCQLNLSVKSLVYSHVGVKLEVSGPVAEGEVVLGQFGLGRVKSHLVAGQPALVAQHSSGVDDGTLEVDVTAQVHIVALVAGLQLPALLTEKRVHRVKYELPWDTLMNDTSLS